MIRSSLLVVALGATALAGSCAPPADTREEGSAEEAVAPADVVEEAVWSADGRRLAVTWTEADRTRLVGLLGPVDGEVPGEATGLPLADGAAGWASWSPDGLWVVYSAGAVGGRNVVRARPDGTAPENLTHSSADDFDPAFSPDGRSIAFVSTREGGVPRLHVMAADGSDPRVLADLVGPARRPMWSPDGNRLAVEVLEEGRPVVYLVTADGRGVGRLGGGRMPAWLPDGSQVTFTENDSIFARPAEGGLRRLVVPDARVGRPSPSGRWMAFVRGSEAEASLWLLDLESGSQSQITPR